MARMTGREYAPISTEKFNAKHEDCMTTTEMIVDGEVRSNC